MIIIHAMNDLEWRPSHALVAGDLTQFRGEVQAVR
jgi:hypothetical protein